MDDDYSKNNNNDDILIVVLCVVVQYSSMYVYIRHFVEKDTAVGITLDEVLSKVINAGYLNPEK
jgi:hypothetical protein